MDSAGQLPHRGSVTAETLPELILRMKKHRSYARLSADCGGVPSDKRLHQMVSGGLKAFPDPPTVRGLARGLPASITEVVLASARALGLRVADGPTPNGISIPGVYDLPEESITAIETMARELGRLVEERRQFIEAKEQETREQQLFPPLLDDDAHEDVRSTTVPPTPPTDLASRRPIRPALKPRSAKRAQREQFERDQTARRAAGHPEFQAPPGREPAPEIDERTAADRGPKRDDEEDDVPPDPKGLEGGA